MTLLNGLLILGGSIIGPSLIGNNSVFLTPLQVNALLSCGFGVLCLIGECIMFECNVLG